MDWDKYAASADILQECRARANTYPADQQHVFSNTCSGEALPACSCLGNKVHNRRHQSGMFMQLPPFTGVPVPCRVARLLPVSHSGVT
jgi:hypothetical protein